MINPIYYIIFLNKISPINPIFVSEKIKKGIYKILLIRVSANKKISLYHQIHLNLYWNEVCSDYLAYHQDSAIKLWPNINILLPKFSYIKKTLILTLIFKNIVIIFFVHFILLLLKVLALFILYTRWESKISNKYENENCVMKIESDV